MIMLAITRFPEYLVAKMALLARTNLIISSFLGPSTEAEWC